MDTNIDNLIEITYKLEKNDYIRASKVILKIKKYKERWSTMVTWLVCLCIGSVVVFNSPTKPKTGKTELQIVPWYLGVLTIIIAALFVIGVVIFSKWSAKRKFDKFYEKNANQHLIDYIFNNIGIEVKTERASLKVLWSEFFKVYILEDLFVIYISKRSAWVIHKKYI